MLDAYVKKLAEQGDVYLKIKARPGAAITEVRGVLVGEDEEVIKIDIAQPPENGKANEELIRFLALVFQVKRQDVKVISGAGDKLKLVRISKNNQ